MFINRTTELKQFEQLWRQGKPQFFIVYGRRRVGKTELIKQFLRGKKGIYFLSDKRGAQEQLQELGKMIGETLEDTLVAKHGFKEWSDLFQYVAKNAKKPFLLAIDEYPYLVESEKAISSLFQKGWDEYLKHSKVFLILSGSSIAMMETEVLGYTSPLYGRRTAQLKLNPLSFREARRFFPKKSMDEFLKIFTITGGIPLYLLQMEPRQNIEENIKRNIFARTSFLHNEIEFILREELREPRTYLSIMKAIAWSKTKFSEICDETGLEKNVMHKYLGVLETLALIEKEVPITEDKPHKSRKGVYKLTDNFARFWFHYVYPYKSYLEIEQYSSVLKRFRETFPTLVAATYEQVCRDMMWELHNKLFPFERVGRWWDRDQEIDVVALNTQTKEIVFGEAKWSNTPVGIDVLHALKAKAHHVEWYRSGSKARKEYYILFSKSGFTLELKHIAREQHVVLVEKDHLV